MKWNRKNKTKNKFNAKGTYNIEPIHDRAYHRVYYLQYHHSSRWCSDRHSFPSGHLVCSNLPAPSNTTIHHRPTHGNCTGKLCPGRRQLLPYSDDCRHHRLAEALWYSTLCYGYLLCHAFLSLWMAMLQHWVISKSDDNERKLFRIFTKTIQILNVRTNSHTYWRKPIWI